MKRQPHHLFSSLLNIYIDCDVLPHSFSSHILDDFRDEVANLDIDTRMRHNKHKIRILSSLTFSSDFISNNAQIFLIMPVDGSIFEVEGIHTTIGTILPCSDQARSRGHIWWIYQLTELPQIWPRFQVMKSTARVYRDRKSTSQWGGWNR